MNIDLTPEQEDKVVEMWLLEVAAQAQSDGEIELGAACDEVLRLNWSYKYD